VPRRAEAEPGHPYGAFCSRFICSRDGRRDEAGPVARARRRARAPPITLDFAPPDAPRHAEHPNPALHAALAGNTAAYRALLQSFARFLPRLSEVPAAARNQEDPHWSNPWIPAFDGIALYCLTALARPRRYVEVGSGFEPASSVGPYGTTACPPASCRSTRSARGESMPCATR